MEDKKYCSFTTYCKDSSGYEKALTGEIMKNLAATGKTVKGKDCFSARPDCFRPSKPADREIRETCCR